MLQASFAEATPTQYRRFLRLIVSPANIFAVELSSSRPWRQFSEAVTISSADTLPSSMASTARSSVTIFVVLAGSLRV